MKKIIKIILFFSMFIVRIEDLSGFDDQIKYSDSTQEESKSSLPVLVKQAFKRLHKILKTTEASDSTILLSEENIDDAMLLQELEKSLSLINELLIQKDVNKTPIILLAYIKKTIEDYYNFLVQKTLDQEEAEYRSRPYHTPALFNGPVFITNYGPQGALTVNGLANLSDLYVQMLTVDDINVKQETVNDLTVSNSLVLSYLSNNAGKFLYLPDNTGIVQATGTSGIGVQQVFAGNNISVDIATHGAHSPVINVAGTTSYAVQVGSPNGALHSLSFGNSGQVLTSQGTGILPQWTTPTGGTVTSVTTGPSSALYISNGLTTTTPRIDVSPSGSITNASITTGTINSNPTSGNAITVNGTKFIVDYQGNTNINGDVTLTNASAILQLPAGSTLVPSLTFTGSTTSGLSANSGNLSLSTNGSERMKISSGGTVSIDQFTAAGVIHNDASGNLSSSLIINADISSSAAISDTKLATISTPGKVANSATTATSNNSPSTIVARDSSGNFSAGTITASLTGHASLDVLKAGDTMTGTLTLPAGSSANPSLQFTGSVNTGLSAPTTNTLSFSTNGAQAMNINSSGQITIDDLNSTGVVHTNASGLLSTSLIVDSDITTATITNDKLATISSSDTPGDIVVRDGSGNFSTNMITIDGNPSANTDVATVAYVKSLAGTGLVVHPAADVIGVSNYSPYGEQTIDGITLASGNRVLLQGQTSAIENGLWVAAVGALSPWYRPTDFANGSPAGSAYVLITEGNTYAGSSWVCSTPTAIIGSSPLYFEEFSLPNQVTGANVGAGTGQVFKNKTGITLNFRTITGDSYLTASTSPTEVTINSNASPSNILGTIVARDKINGGFSAGSITATGLTVNGDALVSGTTTLHNTNIDLQSEIDFHDLNTGNYVGLQAPATVNTSYTLLLPPSSPTINQVLQAGSTNPLQLEWVAKGGDISPSVSRTIYVSQYGNDTTGDGSFEYPYASLAKAVEVANGISTATDPVVILISAGAYTENNSVSAISVTAAGISIVGESANSTFIFPNTLSQDLIATSIGTRFIELTFESGGTSTASAISLSGSGNTSSFSNVRVINFQTGISCAGTNSTYLLNYCVLTGNGTALNINDNSLFCNSCSITGDIATPANTGISAIGALADILYSGGIIENCETGVTLSSNADFNARGTGFRNNSNSIIQSGSSTSQVNACTFQLNQPSGVSVQVSGAGTTTEIIGSYFNGANSSGTPQGTAIQVTNEASGILSAIQVMNYETGIQLGSPSDTSSTIVSASSTDLMNMPSDIVQNGSATLTFNGTSTSNKISINDSAHVELNYFDQSNNTLTIGKASNTDTPLITVATSTSPSKNPQIVYNPTIYSTQAVGYQNQESSPASVFALTSSDANLTAITTDRTKIAGLRLVSDTGLIVGGTSALRGWDINKSPSAAKLSFNYQNSDTGDGQSVIPEYTLLQLDGVNNQVQLPNTATEIIFGGDTDLYRSAANTLKTNGNLIVGTSLTVTPLTAHGVLVGEASNPIVAVAPGVAGQVLTSNGSSADPSFQSLGLIGAVTSVKGGTGIDVTGTATSPVINLSPTTTNALQIGSADHALQSLSFGAPGYVLTSQGTNNSPQWKSLSSAGAITTINGDTGSVIPANGAVTFNANSNAGATVKFSGSGSTMDLLVTSPSTGNTFIGLGAGSPSSTGGDNTAIGYNALAANTTGSSNTAVGFGALGANTTGVINTAVGYNALMLNTGGRRNIAVGASALAANTIGSNNTAVGPNALSFNTTGNDNTAVGISTLSVNTTGSNNTAVGSNASGDNTTGINNTAVGASALSSLVDGSTNIAIGINAGLSYTGTESDNIVIGTAGASGESNTIRIGDVQTSCYIAGISGESPSGSITPVYINSSGQLGTVAPTGGSVTTINGDTGSVTPTNGAVTFNAASTAGSTVSFSGSGSLMSLNTTTNRNTFIGLGAGNSSAASGNIANTAVGDSALNALGTSSSGSNVAFGDSAGRLITTGIYNTAIGQSSLTAASNTSGVTTGSNNVTLGRLAGSNYTSSESSNILIGSSVGGTVGESNTLRIGNATGTGDGNINASYISGIYNISPAGPVIPVYINASGQLGTVAPTGGSITAINGDTGSVTPTNGTVTFNANSNAGATVKFSGSGSTMDLLVTSPSSFNTFIGLNAGNIAATGSNNASLGYQALQNNTTGSYNAAFGCQALVNNNGNYNTAVGYAALQANTTGAPNTAIGSSALTKNTVGNNNIAVGNGALGNNTLGNQNVTIGDGSLYANTTGNANTAVGHNALNQNTASNNIGVGYNALSSLINGASNIALGINAGNQLSTTTAANTVTQTINSTSFDEPFLSAITPDGSTLYVCNHGNNNTVNIINTATNTVTSTLSGFNLIEGIAITPDGKTAYVSNNAGNSVSIIDIATNTVSEVTDPKATFNGPIGIAITPDGGTAYVCNQNGNSVSIINVATNTVTGSITSGTFNIPIGIAITPNGSTAYVSNNNGNSVSIIDIATNTVTGTVSDPSTTFNGPDPIAITPDGSTAYVGNGGGGSVSIVDIATNTVTGTVSGGTFNDPSEIAIAPNGNTAYVSNFLGANVSIIDIATNAVIGTISGTFNNPGMIAITPDGLNAYIPNETGGSSNSGYVNVVNLVTLGSNNIYLGNQGSSSDGGVIRIGTPGSQQACYMAGIYSGPSASPSAGRQAVMIDSYGQLSTYANLGTVLLQGDTGNVLSGANFVFDANSNAGSTVKFSTSPYLNTMDFLVTDPTLFNTFIGLDAGSPSTTGINNVALGYNTLIQNTSGGQNIAIGINTLNANTTGGYNTAIGFEAMNKNTTGTLNTAIGAGALQTNVSSNNSTAVGFQALTACTGGNNTAVGYRALANVTSGNANIALGYDAGNNITTGINNIIIGNNGSSSDSSVIRIGASQTTCYIAGIYGVTVSGGTQVYIDSAGQLGTVTSSRRYKENITPVINHDKLMQLEPVQFTYKVDNEKRKQYGLIAEDVYEIYPELVVHNNKGEIETVRYDQLHALLLKGLQSQQAEINELKNIVEKQQRLIDALFAQAELAA